jgi:hypothetical protein
LLVFATNEFGMLVGHFVSGRARGRFALPKGGPRLARIIVVSIAVTLFADFVSLVAFSERRYGDESQLYEMTTAD